MQKPVVEFTENANATIILLILGIYNIRIFIHMMELIKATYTSGHCDELSTALAVNKYHCKHRTGCAKQRLF